MRVGQFRLCVRVGQICLCARWAPKLCLCSRADLVRVYDEHMVLRTAVACGAAAPGGGAAGIAELVHKSDGVAPTLGDPSTATTTHTRNLIDQKITFHLHRRPIIRTLGIAQRIAASTKNTYSSAFHRVPQPQAQRHTSCSSESTAGIATNRSSPSRQNSIHASTSKTADSTY
jgi:hypothetical protein